jgi:cystathionine beta-lyase
MRAITRRLPEELIARAGSLGVIATTAAYRDGIGWLDDLLVVLDRNRRLLAELVAEQLPAIRYQPPEGTYLAWLDCRRLALPSEPVEVFLERGRVALAPGPNFGQQGRGFVRVAMATSAAILQEIVDRMRAAISAA